MLIGTYFSSSNRLSARTMKRWHSCSLPPSIRSKKARSPFIGSCSRRFAIGATSPDRQPSAGWQTSGFRRRLRIPMNLIIGRIARTVHRSALPATNRTGPFKLAAEPTARVTLRGPVFDCSKRPYRGANPDSPSPASPLCTTGTPPPTRSRSAPPGAGCRCRSMCRCSAHGCRSTSARP